jgi:signal transduction histidine kinase
MSFNQDRAMVTESRYTKPLPSTTVHGARGRLPQQEVDRNALSDAIAARDRLAFLNEVGALLTSSLNYDETLDRAVHLALPRLGDYCALVIPGDRGTPRTIATAHVVSEKEPVVRALARQVIDDPNSNTSSLTGAVMAAGRPLVVPNVSEAAARTALTISAETRRIGRELQPVSYIGVPLLVGGRVVGAIAFGTTEDCSSRRYTPSDAPFVEEFARWVALAVENAELYRLASDSNRLKDEFLATFSHELRTPLSSILGWSRILGSGQSSDETKMRAVRTIERSAQALARMVDDILDLAGGASGTLRLERAAVNLSDVARRTVDLIAPSATARRVSVAVEAPEAVWVDGDGARLEQITGNLLSNSLKFTPEDGHVRVEVESAAGRAVLRVVDDGIGIDAEFLPHVFEKFRQAEGAFTRRFGGLGLGLAIARHLVELHGGSVEATSDGQGRGATFTVRLPLASAAETSVAAP